MADVVIDHARQRVAGYLQRLDDQIDGKTWLTSE